MSKPKFTKDTVPTGFTLQLAAVDALPVLFFGGSMVIAGLLFQSPLFLLGAALSLFAGAAKVVWKFIVVLRRKNIWWLFLQMRILMPLGMLLMLLGAGFSFSRKPLGGVWSAMCSLPAAPWFIAGLLGMALMIVFAFRLDSSDPKANWIEQLTNGCAQAAFFIGLLLVLLR